MLSYDYIQFLNEKVLEYLPHDKVRVGNKVNFRCIFCGDSHKSATKKRGFYYLNNASYYCFNCGTAMSGIKLLESLSGRDYDEIKREYLKLYAKSGFNMGLSAQYEVPKTEPGIFDLKSVIKPEWKKQLSKDASDYIAGRMVDRAPFLKEDLYSCIGKSGEYILIPWIVNGVEAYYQLNDYKKLGPIKYVFPKNKKKLVYGLDNIDATWPYIIVFEGVYDSLFVKNAVAVGTKSITQYQLDLIKERWPNHKIVVSFDNDAPGIESMTKIVERGDHDLFFKWFDQNTVQKDINEYVIAHNDPRAFTKPKHLEKMMLTPLQMKMWLVQSGNWKDQTKAFRRQSPKRAVSPSIDLKSKRALFE